MIISISAPFVSLVFHTTIQIIANAKYASATLTRLGYMEHIPISAPIPHHPTSLASLSKCPKLTSSQNSNSLLSSAKNLVSAPSTADLEKLKQMLPNTISESKTATVKMKKVLVFDMDETMVEAKEIYNSRDISCTETIVEDEDYQRWCVFVRPGLEELLEGLSQYYRLVLWSAASMTKIKAIVDSFPVLKRFFSSTTTTNNEIFDGESADGYEFPVKNLEKLNFDLKSTILIDNAYWSMADQTIEYPAKSGQWLFTNGILIPDMNFVGIRLGIDYQQQNKALLEFLYEIREVDDVRVPLLQLNLHLYTHEQRMQCFGRNLAKFMSFRT